MNTILNWNWFGNDRPAIVFYDEDHNPLSAVALTMEQASSLRTTTNITHAS